MLGGTVSRRLRKVTELPPSSKRVAGLLRSLRLRTPREIAIATIGLGGCFTPEMKRALELLAAERSGLDEREGFGKRMAPVSGGHNTGACRAWDAAPDKGIVGAIKPSPAPQHRSRPNKFGFT